MKILGSLAAIIILSGTCYVFGYRKGGEDFAYLDHMTIGMLSNLEIQRCENNQDPHGCYKWNQESTIGHAFIFYTQYSEKLSPVARYIFPESYETHTKAVSNLFKLATETNHKALCAYVNNLGAKEFAACEQEIASFAQLAGQHINKAKQQGPSAGTR